MSFNIRQLPAAPERVETGPVQFGDDWPGVFIRGDHAFSLCAHLDGPEPLREMAIKQLRTLLARSDLTGISAPRDETLAKVSDSF
jgi:hypothetical protein